MLKELTSVIDKLGDVLADLQRQENPLVDAPSCS
jgi:hypothetical protein